MIWKSILHLIGTEDGWGEPTRTPIPWRQGFRPPTRNAQIHWRTWKYTTSYLPTCMKGRQGTCGEQEGNFVGNVSIKPRLGFQFALPTTFKLCLPSTFSSLYLQLKNRWSAFWKVISLAGDDLAVATAMEFSRIGGDSHLRYPSTLVLVTPRLL